MDRKEKQAFMKRGVARMHQRWLYVAIKFWVENLYRRKFLMSKANMARWMRRTSATCVLAWHKLTREEIRKQIRMKCIVKKMTSNLLCKPFVMWVDNAQELQCEQNKKERKQNVMKRILSKMMNQIMAEVFEKWHGYMAQGLQIKDHLKRIVIKIMVKSTRNASFLFASRHDSVIKTMRTQAVMQQTMLTMTKFCSSSVLAKWQIYAVQAAKTRSVLKKLVVRIRHQGISSALSAWCVNVVEAARVQNGMRRIFGRMTRGSLSLVIGRWLVIVNMTRVQRVAELRLEIALKNIIIRMRHGSMVCLLARWVENIHLVKEERKAEFQLQLKAAAERATVTHVTESYTQQDTAAAKEAAEVCVRIYRYVWVQVYVYIYM